MHLGLHQRKVVMSMSALAVESAEHQTPENRIQRRVQSLVRACDPDGDDVYIDQFIRQNGPKCLQVAACPDHTVNLKPVDHVVGRICAS